MKQVIQQVQRVSVTDRLLGLLAQEALIELFTCKQIKATMMISNFTSVPSWCLMLSYFDGAVLVFSPMSEVRT